MDEKFPVELRNVYFTRTIIEAVPQYNTAENSNIGLPPENQINVQHIEGSEGEYIVVMQTLLNPNKDVTAPYRIDIECIALLHVDAKLDKDEAMKAATITGHSVVYGAIRESVLWITGRHPHGPYTLGLSVLRNKKTVTDEEINSPNSTNDD